MSLFFISGGTAGGWALTFKLAGEDAALSFLYIGVVTVLVMSLTQVVFFEIGKRRMIYRVMFNIAFISGIIWFMLCLLLPVLWLRSVGSAEKTVLFLFLLVLCAANVFRASQQFKSKWDAEGESALARHYNSKNNTIDWPKILKQMKFSFELYVPGIPERMNPFISVAIVLSMLVGLNLRNYFPTFSLFAWGIPSCFIISVVVQMIGLCIAQITKLIALEKKYGGAIAPKS